MRITKIILLSVLTLAVAACTLYYYKYKDYYTTEENDSFKIKIGETFKIKLYANGSTGYINCWLNERTQDLVKKTNESYEPEPFSGRCEGCGGVETLVFTGLKKGSDTIKFASCPTGQESQTCEYFSDQHTPADHLFFITVE